MPKKKDVAVEPTTPKTRAIFHDGEQFTGYADEYFAKCDENGELYDEAGLALYLSKKVGRNVLLGALRSWYDGTTGCKIEGLQEAVQMAYMRIQHQIAVDPRYQEKGGMSSRAIFLNKQIRFGGYQDKIEAKSDIAVNVKFGTNMEESDFK